MQIVSIVLLALAVSVDGLAAGISLGMRRIEIPLWSLLIISLTSGLAIFSSMVLGRLIAMAFSLVMAHILGAVILLILGLWVLLQGLASEERAEGILFQFRIPLLGLIIRVMKEPGRADLDDSGRINNREAYLLGFALAMDAAGAGLGASLLGFNIYLIPFLVALVKFILLFLGSRIGEGFKDLLSLRGQKILPGLILILLGFFQLIALFWG